MKKQTKSLTYVVVRTYNEPDLMYSEAEIITTMDELFDAFAPAGHELARKP